VHAQGGHRGGQQTPRADVITFKIPSGNGFATIKPQPNLPVIKDRVTIDGYTQPGASPNTLAKGTNAQLRIELDGTNAGTRSSGLSLGSVSSGSVVKGLVINRFGHHGIQISSDQNRIEGNFIGTGLDGALDLGNSSRGVEIFPGSNNTVGGSSPAQRNLISGNNGDGVQINATSVDPASNNRVQGNLVGAKKDGVTALGNGQNGVLVLGSNLLFPNSTSNNTVSGNTVAFNGKDGVQVATFQNNIEGANGNGLFGNSIFANAEQGIDLGADGPTANDAGDSDKGPNALQNSPVLSTAKTVNGVTTVQGKLNSTPNKTFLVQFFSNPSGNEGKKSVGQVGVTTDASGNASFTFSPATAVAVGQNVTATAILTSESNNFNTSEFSAPRTVASS
jgi:trimeric autotransporter adhesin